MKRAILGFFDKKPDHPLADVKTVQRLIHDLPKGDALKSLLEISDWFESVGEIGDFRADQRFEIVQLLDDAARHYLVKLAREYYGGISLATFQENRIQAALNNFYARMAQAYHGLLTGYENNSKGSAALKAHFPLIAVRGMHALQGRMKCAVARYEKVSPDIWRQLAEFYVHAESHKYADTPVKLYADFAFDITVTRKFLIVLMWYAPVASRMNPARIHIAEKLTEHWGTHFLISPNITADSVLSFDLAQPDIPDRITGDSSGHANMRFLSAASVNPHIERLFKTLENNIVPDELALGGLFEAAVVADVVRSLATFWVNPPPVRRHARHHVKIKLGVVHGFENIVKHITTGSGSSKTSWDAEDISATGCSCVLQARNAEGIRVGSLMGIQPEKIPHYGVGVVRRINRDELGNLHVGIEMFGNQVSYAPLRTKHDNNANIHQALFLKSAQDQKGQVRLLLGRDNFSTNRSLYTQYEDHDCLLIPIALLENGSDFELASYRVVLEEAADETH
ncbi:MAG: hypothetical protein ABL860_00625 [Candidatus Nitrotoga sp.]